MQKLIKQRDKSTPTGHWIRGCLWAPASSKMKLPVIPSWPWSGYCHQPPTPSIRSCIEGVSHNSFLDQINWENDDIGEFDWAEIVIRSVRSERLFFEPRGETASILGVESRGSGDEELTLGKSHLLASMDSHDPYMDFKISMEEMVQAHGLKEWDSLEELLSCYLTVNGKKNHGYILAAFADLIVNRFVFASCRDSCSGCTIISQSPVSPFSYYVSSSSASSCSTDHSSSLRPCLYLS